jgi:hypothetical protein
VITETGTIMIKKITLKMTGLTIFPKNKPRLNHALLSGFKADGIISVISAKRIDKKMAINPSNFEW